MDHMVGFEPTNLRLWSQFDNPFDIVPIEGPDKSMGLDSHPVTMHDKYGDADFAQRPLVRKVAIHPTIDKCTGEIWIKHRQRAEQVAKRTRSPPRLESRWLAGMVTFPAPNTRGDDMVQNPVRDAFSSPARYRKFLPTEIVSKITIRFLKDLHSMHKTAINEAVSITETRPLDREHRRIFKNYACNHLSHIRG